MNHLKTLQTSESDIRGCEDTAQLLREEQQNGSRARSYSHTTTSKAEEFLQPTSVLPGESLEGSRVPGPFLWLQKTRSRDQDYSVQPVPLILCVLPNKNSLAEAGRALLDAKAALT